MVDNLLRIDSPFHREIKMANYSLYSNHCTHADEEDNGKRVHDLSDVFVITNEFKALFMHQKVTRIGQNLSHEGFKYRKYI